MAGEWWDFVDESTILRGEEDFVDKSTILREEDVFEVFLAILGLQFGKDILDFYQG